ncbi:MAG: hypothetical protein ACI92Z_003141 [Paracoccaceae bacterium]|jgi:hypothetical protein
MTSWNKYWARLRTVICVAVAFGILLLPAAYAHAEMAKTSASYDMSTVLSDADHQRHSVGSDTHTISVHGATDATDNHHDSQCCPAGCISVALIDLFINVSPKKSSVQAGFTPNGLTSADVSGILRPPLA